VEAIRLSENKDKKLVNCDASKCTGCRICEYACSMKKEKTYNPTKSRIRAIRLNPFVNLAVSCRLCEDAPCVVACPRDALEQDEETGVIKVDEEKCNGCGWCIEACDYGALELHPETKQVFVCDLCDGEPECVKWCPEGALEFTSKDDVSEKTRITAIKKLFQNALKTE
jgi:anaerobic carbon-monoxide dehydrogenase iron sulfur subunit